MDKPNLKSVKDKLVIDYIEYLEKLLKSPYANTYLAIYKQIEDWNKQLNEKNIDLFADKDSKEFDRSFKYFMEASDVLERLDKMRAKMSPQDLEEINKKKPLSEDSAENYLKK